MVHGCHRGSEAQRGARRNSSEVGGGCRRKLATEPGTFLQPQFDVNQISSKRQSKQCGENSDQVHQESRRLEPAQFELMFRFAVEKQALNAKKTPGNYPTRAEPDRKPCRRPNSALDLHKLTDGK